MFDLDATCLPCEEEFKQNINIANDDLDHQQMKSSRTNLLLPTRFWPQPLANSGEVKEGGYA